VGSLVVLLNLRYLVLRLVRAFIDGDAAAIRIIFFVIVLLSLSGPLDKHNFELL
jgi:hypothetical protein